MNGNEPNEMLSAQKELARETVKAVADVFALKVILASTGREEDEVERELAQLRQTALYKRVVEAGEFRIDRAEQNQQLLDLMVRIRSVTRLPALWKDANPRYPFLKEAKGEYAKLQ